MATFSLLFTPPADGMVKLFLNGEFCFYFSQMHPPSSPLTPSLLLLPGLKQSRQLLSAPLSLLRDTFGTHRIRLQLSFPDCFFFSFFPLWNQEGYFIPANCTKMKGEGGWVVAQIQAPVTPTRGRQIKYKLRVAAGPW